MKMLDFRRMAAMVTAALLLSGFAARADEGDEVARLYRQGNLVEALEQADAYLSRNPGDAQMRFQKGLILTEQKKTADAINVFSSLSKDYPDLPEPHNNLAVLYASQGEYDKARDALEAAIRTHPSYSTAHENLGDVYAKMASQAYGKALQLDKDNAAAQTKLSMIKDLFTDKFRGVNGASAPVGATTPVPVNGESLRNAGNTPKPPKKAAADIQKKPASDKPASTAPAGGAILEKIAGESVGVEKSATHKIALANPSTEKPSIAQSAAGANAANKSPEKSPGEPAAEKGPMANDAGEIIDTIQAWAKAWSDKNVSAYLAFYADDFRFSGFRTRAAWEKSRHERIARPKSIQVTIGSPKVQFMDATHARISFRQSYRSDSFKNDSSKKLEMVKKGKKWLIKQERSGR